MKRFLVKHLLFLLLTLLVVSFLVFTLNEFSPGAVARKVLGAYATQEQVDLLTKQMGLDRPVLVRYVEYLGALVSGDLGYSARFKAPVKDVIFKHLANTALLAAVAFACIVPLSTLLGVVAGMREASRLDRGILMFSTVIASIPEFALGVFLASVFVVWLGWLPGTATLVAGGGWSVAAQLVLPVTVVVLFDSGYVVSMIRASMVEVMQRPYIRTAVLKGLPFRAVILRHALRNAMLTPITVIMLQINYLVAGVVVVETVFAYPGFGRMILEAALFKDIALIEAGALAGYRSARARPALAHSVGRSPGPHHRAARGARRRGTRLASRPGGRLLRTLDRPRHHARVRHRAFVPGHHPLHDHPRPLRLIGVEHRRRPHADQGADHRPHRAWHDARPARAGVRGGSQDARRVSALHHAGRDPAQCARAARSRHVPAHRLQRHHHWRPWLPRHRPAATRSRLGRHGQGHVRDDDGVAAHGALPVRGHLVAGRRLQPARRRAAGAGAP